MLDLFRQTVLTYSVSILPWFALGVIVALIVEKYIHPKVISKYFSHSSLPKLIFSLFLGMISPLSIMSFLPVANEFVSLGFNPGILFSFLLAERAYDLQSFFIVTSLFGIKVAFLNALAILLSLLIVSFSLRGDQVSFSHSKQQGIHDFWPRQIRLLAIIIVGIAAGALLRVIIPQNQFQNLAANATGGILTAIIMGFAVYFGPILGNYPVAKALSDLGMAKEGVFAFLTVSPLFNFIIIMLFSSAVSFKITLKAVMVYALSAVIMTLLFSLFF